MHHAVHGCGLRRALGSNQYDAHSRLAPEGALALHRLAILGRNFVRYNSLVTALGASVSSGKKPLKQCSYLIRGKVPRIVVLVPVPVPRQ